MLGRLGGKLVGGGMQLDRDAAEQAVKTIGDPLDLDVHAAAEAIIAVANANMADAVRIISLQRGYDPREFALVVFGGAGPLHGAALAKELGVPTVLVPPRPGTWSALGCLMVDIRHDLSDMFLRPAADADASELGEAFERLESEGRELLKSEGVSDEEREPRPLDRHALPRPVARLEVSYDGDLDASVERFHTEHEREFSYRRDDAPVELYRLQRRGHRQDRGHRAPEARARAATCPSRSRRAPSTSTARRTDTPVYERSELPAGASFEGPAVIDQLDTTTLVPPGVKAEVDEYLNIVMEVN